MTKQQPFAGRPVIYQIFTRLFTNNTPDPVPDGDLARNGAGKMNDITPAVLRSVKELGVTHVWYTGVIEHAQATDYSAYGIRPDNPFVVKGKAGSPYAIKDYYDIDPDLAVSVPDRMKEFEALVARTHRAGLKVITDFVPNHVARQYHSDAAPAGVRDLGDGDNPDVFFTRDNNFYYIPRQKFAPHFYIDGYDEMPAKCTGNDCFTAFPGRNDWYETVKLNYGYDPGNGSRHYDPVPRTWHDMLAIMMFWASKGIDGMRCDMVHMVPVEFWHWAIPQVKERYPHIVFIAEIYDVALYRSYLEWGGFDYLYDKVTLYDTLRGIQTSNVSAAQLTSAWQTVDGLSGKMLSFLENHDEQRYASREYTGTPYTVLPALVAIATMNTGAVMIYMAQELGEDAPDAEGFSGHDGRTTIFDYWSLDRLRRWLNGGRPSVKNLTEGERNLRETYASVLRLVNIEPALREGGFFDVTYANYGNPGFDPHRHYAYLRHKGGEVVLVVLNFGGDADIAVNIPAHAFECLEMAPERDAHGTDLLTGAFYAGPFTDSEPVRLHVDANGAALLKFKLS
ncbi:MAG: alpha-amylase family protein [Muribaculaceae bacterium]